MFSVELHHLFEPFFPGFLFIESIWAQVGGHDQLNISAWPSPVVPLGEHVSLHCHSHLGFAMFSLRKEDGTHIPELQDRFFQEKLLMRPVTAAHAGTYRCFSYYSQTPSVRSASSNPLQITVTGLYMKPSLSSQPGPVVMSGENVMLSCSSECFFDMYHLSRVVKTPDPWLTTVQRQSGALQADFLLGPVTPAHKGTYRCHGSFNQSPYEWSDPSDPLHILVKESDLPGTTHPRKLYKYLPTILEAKL
ncbi:killer cell immunoglobulin-like receptor 2DL5A [Dasypus novemcinctus]|uniref:killer cell immunoglobulin-like receptor 2DL5A n=1 Tax=Dasypus novemcinctus TaxID=9361 RepID=UPI00265FCBA7|nr:killer cell immunoglobulin-like receptor 2DL5A [Dasypus novemcinctus]